METFNGMRMWIWFLIEGTAEGIVRWASGLTMAEADGSPVDMARAIRDAEGHPQAVVMMHSVAFGASHGVCVDAAGTVEPLGTHTEEKLRGMATDLWASKVKREVEVNAIAKMAEGVPTAEGVPDE